MSQNPANSGTKPIAVAIVEDDDRVRGSLSLLISRAEGFVVVGAFPDGETALAEIPRCGPEVVLMDINLPGMSGIDCVRALRARLPGVRIVMLTVYDEADSLLDSLKAGASGYLLKRSPSAKILEAIVESRMGGMPMSRQMAGKVAQYTAPAVVIIHNGGALPAPAYTSEVLRRGGDAAYRASNLPGSHSEAQNVNPEYQNSGRWLGDPQ